APDRSWNRRRFLRGAAGAALAAILAACGGKATSTPVSPTTAPASPTVGTTPTVPPTATAANPAAAARTSVAGSPAATTGIAATAPVASGAASAAKGERDVTFTSGADTIYGTLLLPATGGGQKLPAAVILAGS